MISRRIKILVSISILLIATTSCSVILPASVIGITSAIAINDPRSLGMQIDDNVIASKVKNAVKASSIDLPSLSIHVIEGRVMLNGCSRKKNDISALTRIAWSIRGTKEVINEIKSCSNKMNSSEDFIALSQIKTRLLVERGIHSSNYRVCVIDSSLYILGIASNKDEKEKVLDIAKSISHIKNITLHVILQNDPRRWNRS